MTTSAGTFHNQGIPMSGTGQVAIVDATAGLPSGTIFHNGLPMSGDKVCVSKNATAVVSNGLPFDSAGALAADVNFDLNFIGTDTLNSSVTFTRASTATYFDSAGVLQSAAIDAPRLDYNPSTLAAQGLLIEESRTNSIRNNTMVGAVAGTPGTAPTNWTASSTGAVTTQIVGTGTENGIAYIDYRFQGSGASDTWNLIYDSSVVAANGQTWTSSVYLKLVGGSTANLPLIQRIVFRNGAFANIQAADSSALTPTSAGLATQRSTLSLTATQATTAFVTNQLNSGTPTGAYDITLRIGLPQLELGAFATSVIPTSTTALTRSADVASVNTLSPWFNATEGTLFAEASVPSTQLINRQMALIGRETSAAQDIGISISRSADSRRLAVIANATSQFSYVPATAVTSSKGALAYKENDSQAAFDGVASAVDTSVSLPTLLARLYLGNNDASDANLNGWLQRVTYYPRRLSDAELQTITA